LHRLGLTHPSEKSKLASKSKGIQPIFSRLAKKTQTLYGKAPPLLTGALLNHETPKRNTETLKRNTETAIFSYYVFSSTETAFFMKNIFYRCYLQWQERQDTGA